MKAAIKKRVKNIEAAIDSIAPAKLAGVAPPYQEWASWDKVFWQLKCGWFTDEDCQRFDPAFHRWMSGDVPPEDQARADEIAPKIERLERLYGVNIEPVHEWAAAIASDLQTSPDIEPEDLPMPPNPEGKHHGLAGALISFAYDPSRRMAFEFPVWHFDSPLAAALYRSGYWLNVAGTVAKLKKA